MSDQQRVVDVLGMFDLGVELEPGSLVVGAIVLMKVVDEDGCVQIASSSSDGIAVFERVGILATAHAYELRDAIDGEDD